MHAFGAQAYIRLPDAKFGAVAFANTSLTSDAIEAVDIYRLIDKLVIPESERFDLAVPIQTASCVRGLLLGRVYQYTIEPRRPQRVSAPRVP